MVALPGAVARARVGRRRVAAAGGAGALPGDGGGVRRRRPAPRHRAVARARGCTERPEKGIGSIPRCRPRFVGTA